VKQPFIADDEEINEMVTDENNNESDEEEDEGLFDSICAICDNGGDLLWYVQSSTSLNRLTKQSLICLLGCNTYFNQHVGVHNTCLKNEHEQHNY
jgi:hypothetical protein